MLTFVCSITYFLELLHTDRNLFKCKCGKILARRSLKAHKSVCKALTQSNDEDKEPQSIAQDEALCDTEMSIKDDNSAKKAVEVSASNGSAEKLSSSDGSDAISSPRLCSAQNGGEPQSGAQESSRYEPG